MLPKYSPSVWEDCCGFVLGTYSCISTFPRGVPVGQPGWTGPTFTWTDPEPTPTSTTSTSGVSTPSPVQTGIIETCDEFYRVSSGDTCYYISQEHNVVLLEFYAWNPAVKTDCTGLQADVYVCVGILPPRTTTTTTITTTTTSSSSSGISTPTPIQSGMVDTCNNFYFVATGDSCYDIASTNAIPLATFYSWNPAWPDNDDNQHQQKPEHDDDIIWHLHAYAHAARDGCQLRQVHRVQSGDGCWDLANALSIALDDFYAWNPAVGGDSSGLQADVYVCVGLM
ncbi:hypothetical protein BJX65DRAFT_314755 [Aspergillus insuetus]